VIGQTRIKKRQIVRFDLADDESPSNTYRLLIADSSVTAKTAEKGVMRVHRIGTNKTAFDFETRLERFATRSQTRRLREFYKRLTGVAFLLILTELPTLMLELGTRSLETLGSIERHILEVAATYPEKEDGNVSNSKRSMEDAAQAAQLLESLQRIFDEEQRHPLASVPILGSVMKVIIRIRNLNHLCRVSVALNKRLIVYYQSLDERLNRLETSEKRR
jgi:hypothetical protein